MGYRPERTTQDRPIGDVVYELGSLGAPRRAR